MLSCDMRNAFYIYHSDFIEVILKSVVQNPQSTFQSHALCKQSVKLSLPLFVTSFWVGYFFLERCFSVLVTHSNHCRRVVDAIPWLHPKLSIAQSLEVRCRHRYVIKSPQESDVGTW